MALRLLTAFAVARAPAAFELDLGAAPYATDDEGVLVGGYICDTWQYARIYYPKAKSGGSSPGKVPLLSFAHGWGEGGLMVPQNYGALLKGVASYGYVVIAGESGVYTPCLSQTKDQLHSIEWVKSSKYSSKVDWSKKTGVLGHSMGAMATIQSASSSSAVSQHNIGAAVMLHPCAQSGAARVPSLFMTGSADNVCLSTYVKAAYNSVSGGVAKAYASIYGALHWECQTGYPNRWTPWVVAHFDCHLQDKSYGCEGIYGGPTTSNCPICAASSCGVTMNECHHAHEPPYLAAAFNGTAVLV